MSFSIFYSITDQKQQQLISIWKLFQVNKIKYKIKYNIKIQNRKKMSSQTQQLKVQKAHNHFSTPNKKLFQNPEIRVQNHNSHNSHNNVGKIMHSKDSHVRSQRNNQPSAQVYENKLPINLFHTAAQYNKMLITNGRSIKKSQKNAKKPLQDAEAHSQSKFQIDHYTPNLQFINDPIFQSCQLRRQSLRYKSKASDSAGPNAHSAKNMYSSTTDRKKPNYSFTQDCACCCCDQFCRTCAKDHGKVMDAKRNYSKISQYQLQKALAKVESKPIKPKKGKKKVITSDIMLKLKSQPPKKSAILIPNQPVVKKQNNNKPHQGNFFQVDSQKQPSSDYLSHKSFNIQSLVYKSLAQFDEKKRQNKMNKLLEKQLQFQKELLMKQFDQEVRVRNRFQLQREKSLGRNKSLNEKKKRNNFNKRLQYWKNTKNTIKQSLKRDKIYGIRPSSADILNKFKYIEQECCHKCLMTPGQIQRLRLLRERAALDKIAEENWNAFKIKKRTEDRLNQVQRNRIRNLRSCEKKAFKPTKQMIESAFKNLIQQKKITQQKPKHPKPNPKPQPHPPNQPPTLPKGPQPTKPNKPATFDGLNTNAGIKMMGGPTPTKNQLQLQNVYQNFNEQLDIQLDGFEDSEGLPDGDNYYFDDQ